MINGQAHGPQKGTATCQLHMRKFADGDTIVIEPWRADAFPVIKDLMVDRSRLRPHHRGRRLHHRGHRLGARRQPHPDPQGRRRRGDGRRRLHRLRRLRGRLPERRRPALHRGQGRRTSTCCPRARPERYARVEAMVEHDGGAASAPARTTASARRRARRRSPIDFIALMNKDYLRAKVKNRRFLSRKP